MPDSDNHKIPPGLEQLHEILMKIVVYQHSLADGRAVELEELRREGVLAPADLEFLTSHSVTSKPHRLSDHHAQDMFCLPVATGGCVFVGPCGPPLAKHRAPLKDFRPIVENFLQLPIPEDELLLHIEFTEHDGMGIAPHMIIFTFRSIRWRERLPALRAIAGEFGFNPQQDEVVQESHLLAFTICVDAAQTAAATVALLSRGCGFSDETEIFHSAGALDAG
jgi:hypothetical protein